MGQSLGGIRPRASETMNRAGLFSTVDEKGRERERYQVVYGARTHAPPAPRSEQSRRNRKPATIVRARRS